MDDRELDAWLAEHLFGWSLVGVKGHWTQGVETRDWSGRPPGQSRGVPHVPALSSTGEGMLKVMEAIRQRGWEWDIADIHINPEFGGFLWRAFCMRDDVTPYPQATHALLPRAVAEAAKEAIKRQPTIEPASAPTTSNLGGSK